MEASMDTRQLTPPASPQSIAEAVCLCEALRIPLGKEALFTPPRAKGTFLLLGVVSGSLSCLIDETSAVCGAGQAVLLLPETEAVLRATEPCTLNCVTLQGTLTERLLRETAEGGLFFSQAIAVAETVSALFSMDEAGFPPDGKTAAAAAFSLLTTLYRQTVTGGRSAYPPLILSALGIMREEFATLYGVEELADQLNVTKNHLIRMFTTAVGTSPGKYLMQLRIEYAKLMLRGGEASLEAVAAASGFSGASYFGKVFRRATGVTPREYAAMHAELPTVSTDSLYV